jgi:hypothetical protein
LVLVQERKWQASEELAKEVVREVGKSTASVQPELLLAQVAGFSVEESPKYRGL